MTALGSTRLTSRKSRSARLACVRSGPTTALAVQLVAGGAVLGEQGLARLRVAAAGPQVVVQPADLGQLLLGRRPADVAPVLARPRASRARSWWPATAKQFVGGKVLGGTRPASTARRSSRGPAARLSRTDRGRALDRPAKLRVGGDELRGLGVRADPSPPGERGDADRVGPCGGDERQELAS